MKKLLVLAWAGAAMLSGGMLRAENILLSTRNSSLLLTAEKGKTPLFQYFGARVASPDDILASGAAFGDAAYPQFGAQCYREVAIQATHGDGSMSLELAVESVSRDRRNGSETTAIAMKDKHLALIHILSPLKNEVLAYPGTALTCYYPVSYTHLNRK